MSRPTSLLLAFLTVAGTLGCLYVPPLSQTSGRKEVLALRPGEETRQSLQVKLGVPDMVDLPSVQVWEWRQNRGTLLFVSPAGAGGLSLEGATFKVLARYEGDRAVALEAELEPDKGSVEDPPPPLPAERIPLKGANPLPPESKPASGPKYYRAWVAPGGEIITLGREGDLWLKTIGPSQSVKVADLSESSWEGNVNDTQESLSRDGRLLALSRGGQIIVWDVAGSKEAARLPIFDAESPKKAKPVRGMAIFSPDGKWLAVSALSFSGWSSGARSCLKVLEVGSWKTLWSLEESERKAEGPHHIQFSPDGTRLLADASYWYLAGSGKYHRDDGGLYETATGHRLARSPAPVAVFYAEGRRYAALGDELELRESDNGRLLGRVPLRTGPGAQSEVKDGWKDFTARVLPDGSLLAAGKGLLISCDLVAFERALTASLPTQGQTPSVDGRAFLQVRLLPLRNRHLRTFSEPGSEEMPLRSWHVSPRGDFILERVLVNRTQGFSAFPFWGTQALWLLDARTLGTLWVERPSREDQGVAEFTRDGRFLRTIGSEVRIWDLPKPVAGP